MVCGIRKYALEQGQWIHLDYQKAEAQQWLRDESGLDPLVIRALQLKDPRPRTHYQNGGILLSLRGVNVIPGADPDTMVSVRIYIDKKRIITSNHRKLNAVMLTEKMAAENRAGKTPFEVFLMITQKMVSLIDDAVDEHEDLLLELETAIIDGKNTVNRTELMNIRKQMITLRRHLTPQREAFSKLIIEPLPWIEQKHTHQLREISDHQIRILENIDALRERAVITHEELVSRVSDQLNSRIYRLSVISAIFLPLTFLTGLLGINLAGIPGAESSSAFFTFVGILFVTVILQLLFFRWRKWL